MNSTEKKMTMPEAKALLEEGDKLKLVCHEVKVLRNAIRSARSWLSQFKKCKVGHGGTAASELESLIDEHESLLIAMPGEIDKLKQATQGFCLCRRPYEGFMIGCDECDEWYHGPCVGITESQADRYDKYVCVRCSVRRVFNASASVIAGVIKKWTSAKDRKKARQAEYQKHQRKVRKEKKDVEKYELKIREYCLQVASLENEVANRGDDVELLNSGQSRILEATDDGMDGVYVTNDELSPKIEASIMGCLASRVESCSPLPDSECGAAFSEPAKPTSTHSLFEGEERPITLKLTLQHDHHFVENDAEPDSPDSVAAATEEPPKQSHSSINRIAKGNEVLDRHKEGKSSARWRTFCLTYHNPKPSFRHQPQNP